METGGSQVNDWNNANYWTILRGATNVANDGQPRGNESNGRKGTSGTTELSSQPESRQLMAISMCPILFLAATKNKALTWNNNEGLNDRRNGSSYRLGFVWPSFPGKG